MRVITLNANGLRSAAAKGFYPWLARQKADVVCVQEVKANLDDLPQPLREPRGWHAVFNCAQKKGYSGVALYSREKPDRVVSGFGSNEFDPEGRYLQADFGKLSVVSLYVPSGSSSDERQQAKFRFLDGFLPHLATLRKAGREFLFCGDINIAHKEIDLRNWRSNQKNSGFLPQERAWLTHLFDEIGYVDIHRRLDQRAEQYTWWSNRGESWTKNVGWRLDYQIGTPGIAGKAKRVAIYTAKRFSDHAPVTVDYDL